MSKTRKPAGKPTARTRKKPAPAAAPEQPEGIDPKARYMITGEELDNLRKYVMSRSTSDLKGQEMAVVIACVHEPLLRPVKK